MISMGAGGIDDIAALDRALVGSYTGDAAILYGDSLDDAEGGETNTKLAALVRVGVDHTA